MGVLFSLVCLIFHTLKIKLAHSFVTHTVHLFFVVHSEHWLKLHELADACAAMSCETTPPPAKHVVAQGALTKLFPNTFLAPVKAVEPGVESSLVPLVWTESARSAQQKLRLQPSRLRETHNFGLLMAPSSLKKVAK